MPKLVLYKFDSCPYCQRVRRYMDDNNMKIEMKDTMIDRQSRDELKKIGGKTQVPCLVIDDKALYETNDIIKWLESNYKK